MHYCNIDGYVKDKTVNIFYYSNFNDQDERYYPTSGETGASHTVLDYGDTMLLSRPGYEFTGWNTEKDGTGDSYNAAETFTITGPTDLYAQWEEIKYTPSEQPTATLTLKKTWADGITGGQNDLPSSVNIVLKDASNKTYEAEGSGSVTVGTAGTLIFKDLTPGGEYTVVETPADTFVANPGTIKLNELTVTGMSVSSATRVTDCADLERNGLQGANYVVFSVKSNATYAKYEYVVWTYADITGAEDKFIDAFEAATMTNPDLVGPFVTGKVKTAYENGHVKFISGATVNYNEDRLGLEIMANSGTATLQHEDNWQQYVYGGYGYEYGGTEAKVTVHNTLPLTPYINIEKAGTTNVTAGDEIAYTITVQNTGTAAATADAVVTDTLPAGLTLVSAAADKGDVDTTTTSGTVTWTISKEDLPANQSAPYTLTVTATVSSDFTDDSVTNTASLVTDDPHKGSDDHTTTVTRVGVLNIQGKSYLNGSGAAVTVPEADKPVKFFVKDSAGTVVGNTDGYALAEITSQAGVSITLPYGTYTIAEEFASGKDGSFQQTTAPKGSYSAPVLSVVGASGTTASGATVTIDGSHEAASLVNTYTFTPETEVHVSYAWDTTTSGTKAWATEFPNDTDPLNTAEGAPYAAVTLITGEGGTQNNYAAPGVPTASMSMPTGYSITGWFADANGDGVMESYTVEQATTLVRSLGGGDSIILYARLTDNMPTYKIKYDYYYKLNDASTYQQVKNSDGNAYVDPKTAWATVSSRTAPTAKALYNSIKAGEITGVSASFTKEVGTAPSLTYSMASEWETDEVTSTGSLAAGDLVYTVKVYGQYYTVGSLTITKTIDLPRSETAAWNALKDTLTFTVTATLDSGEAFTPETVSLKDFEDDVHSYFTYTYTLKNLKPGTYTVTESGADILSAYGYTWNAEDSVNSDVAVVTASGTPAVAALENVYDSREFTVIFDATLYGNVHSRNNTLIADGSSFRYEWFVPLVALDANTVSTDPGWQGRLVDETFNDSQASQISYTFTIDDYKEFLNHNNFPIKISQPNVTADQGYTFTGSFTTTGTDTGVKFVDLETTMAALLASGQDQITYYANYSSSSGPIDPGPIDPGPIDPGPIDPGPIDPGTDIPDDNTPTTDLPEEETPTTELPEEETPTTELPEEEVPMAEVPATGDTAGLWALAAGVSGLALVWLALSGKKRREENA
ncbi:isopeptide-forming domain-containing fimbrial protein [Dysosmobacter sp. Phy]